MSKSEESESMRQMESQQQSGQHQHQPIEFVVPTGSKLKACIRCGLLKTEQQWQSVRGCQNCGGFDDWKEKITDKYDNIVSLINPDASWVRKNLRIRIGNKIVAGAYAMNVNQ